MIDLDPKALLRIFIVAVAIGIGISLPPTAALMYLLQHPQVMRVLFDERFPKASAKVDKSAVRLASIEETKSSSLLSPSPMALQPKCRPTDPCTDSITIVRETHYPPGTEPGADGCPLGHFCGDPALTNPVLFVLTIIGADDATPSRVFRTKAQCIEAGVQFVHNPLNHNKETECVRYKQDQ